MAKAKKAEGEEVKANIDNFEALAKEYKSNKMPEKKKIALRQKLVSLHLDEKITPDEQELMEAILRKERNLSIINARDGYILNKIESERAEGNCIVKTDDAPRVHHLEKDLECKYDFDPDFNDGKNKPDSVGRYMVYVPRSIPTRHQLKNAVVERENLGHPVDPSEYPATKTVIHRLVLKAKEFGAWFEVTDEDALAVEQKEPEYTF